MSLPCGSVSLGSPFSQPRYAGAGRACEKVTVSYTSGRASTASEAPPRLRFARRLFLQPRYAGASRRGGGRLCRQLERGGKLTMRSQGPILNPDVSVTRRRTPEDLLQAGAGRVPATVAGHPARAGRGSKFFCPRGASFRLGSPDSRLRRRPCGRPWAREIRG
jgi:hypothetical protein